MLGMRVRTSDIFFQRDEFSKSFPANTRRRVCGPFFTALVPLEMGHALQTRAYCENFASYCLRRV